jgi:DNA-binding NtrC family response regulator
MQKHEENGNGEIGPVIQRSREAQAELQKGIKSLRRLTIDLADAVKTLEDPQIPPVESGVDFYDEVRRFEIGLIMRALSWTGGVQSRAAAMLKLNSTTLHAKIRQYNINNKLV